MKTRRYTEAQILAIPRQAEGGMPVAELCRAHGMMARQWLLTVAKLVNANPVNLPIFQRFEAERRASHLVQEVRRTLRRKRKDDAWPMCWWCSSAFRVGRTNCGV